MGGKSKAKFTLYTQFHAEFKSGPGRPDPAYYGLVKEALDRKLGSEKVDLGKPFSYAATSKD